MSERDTGWVGPPTSPITSVHSLCADRRLAASTGGTNQAQRPSMQRCRRSTKTSKSLAPSFDCASRRPSRVLWSACRDRLSRPPFAIDLGSIGHLRLEHVTTPEYEPHTRAQIAVGAGDSSWCTANPKLPVPPAVQALEVLEMLRAVNDEARGLMIGWPLLRHFAPVAESLRLRGRSVDPERFTVGFAPARELDAAETAATFVFVGAALITVKADGCRMAFLFWVPADFDKSLQPYVSGWWTARSGDRFASILRVGHRSGDSTRLAS